MKRTATATDSKGRTATRRTSREYAFAFVYGSFRGKVAGCFSLSRAGAEMIQKTLAKYQIFGEVVPVVYLPERAK